MRNNVLMPYSLDPAIARNAAEIILTTGAAPGVELIQTWLQNQEQPGRSGAVLARNIIKDLKNEKALKLKPNQISLTIAVADGPLFEKNVLAEIIQQMQLVHQAPLGSPSDALATAQSMSDTQEKKLGSAAHAKSQSNEKILTDEHISDAVTHFLANLSAAVELEFSSPINNVFKLLNSPSRIIHWNQLQNSAPEQFKFMMYAGTATLWQEGVMPLARLIDDDKKNDPEQAQRLESIFNIYFEAVINTEAAEEKKALFSNLITNLAEAKLITDSPANRMQIDRIIKVALSSARKYLKTKLKQKAAGSSKTQDGSGATQSQTSSNEGLRWSLLYISHELSTFATHMRGHQDATFIPANNSRGKGLASAEVNAIQQLASDTNNASVWPIQETAGIAEHGHETKGGSKAEKTPSVHSTRPVNLLLQKICVEELKISSESSPSWTSDVASSLSKKQQSFERYKRNWILSPEILDQAQQHVANIIDRHLPSLIDTPLARHTFNLFLKNINKKTLQGRIPPATGFAHRVDDSWDYITKLVLQHLKQVIQFFHAISTPVSSLPFTLQTTDERQPFRWTLNPNQFETANALTNRLEIILHEASMKSATTNRYNPHPTPNDMSSHLSRIEGRRFHSTSLSETRSQCPSPPKISTGHAFRRLNPETRPNTPVANNSLEVYFDMDPAMLGLLQVANPQFKGMIEDLLRRASYECNVRTRNKLYSLRKESAQPFGGDEKQDPLEEARLRLRSLKKTQGNQYSSKTTGKPRCISVGELLFLREHRMNASPTQEQGPNGPFKVGC